MWATKILQTIDSQILEQVQKCTQSHVTTFLIALKHLKSQIYLFFHCFAPNFLYGQIHNLLTFFRKVQLTMDCLTWVKGMWARRRSLDFLSQLNWQKNTFKTRLFFISSVIRAYVQFSLSFRWNMFSCIMSTALHALLFKLAKHGHVFDVHGMGGGGGEFMWDSCSPYVLNCVPCFHNLLALLN